MPDSADPEGRQPGATTASVSANVRGRVRAATSMGRVQGRDGRWGTCTAASACRIVCEDGNIDTSDWIVGGAGGCGGEIEGGGGEGRQRRPRIAAPSTDQCGSAVSLLIRSETASLRALKSPLRYAKPVPEPTFSVMYLLKHKTKPR